MIMRDLADSSNDVGQVKQGLEISHFDKEGIVFIDGSKLLADVVVLAYDLVPFLIYLSHNVLQHRI